MRSACSRRRARSAKSHGWARWAGRRASWASSSAIRRSPATSASRFRRRCPWEEVLELDQQLPDAVGRPLDLIVVNGVYPDRFSDPEAEQLRHVAQRFPMARAALAQHRRARAHAAQVARLREQARAAVVTLPYLFVPRLGPAEYRALSRALA
jgi:hypothetical protein